MNHPAQFFVEIDSLHRRTHNVSLGGFMAACIEALHIRGHTPESAMTILHDHLKLAANQKAQNKE